ncbi:MAG: helix-turn-helix transcriptional regulator [Candidatus Gastranaerophilaceae bacterium]
MKEARKRQNFGRRNNKLTQREQEFLYSAALGMKNREIAKEYVASEYTVKKTLENIFYKIRTKGRNNTVAITILNNLITLENFIV